MVRGGAKKRPRAPLCRPIFRLRTPSPCPRAPANPRKHAWHALPGLIGLRPHVPEEYARARAFFGLHCLALLWSALLQCFGQYFPANARTLPTRLPRHRALYGFHQASPDGRSRRDRAAPAMSIISGLGGCRNILINIFSHGRRRLPRHGAGPKATRPGSTSTSMLHMNIYQEGPAGRATMLPAALPALLAAQSSSPQRLPPAGFFVPHTSTRHTTRAHTTPPLPPVASAQNPRTTPPAPSRSVVRVLPGQFWPNFLLRLHAVCTMHAPRTYAALVQFITSSPAPPALHPPRLPMQPLGPPPWTPAPRPMHIC